MKLSAVLLDLSIEGFKLELVSRGWLKPGEIYWLSIPLRPFDIAGPSQLRMRIVIRWFDPHAQRAGGLFFKPTIDSISLVQDILENLARNSHFHD